MAARLGVLPQSVYNWEAGKAGVDDERAEQLAEALDLDVITTRHNLGLWVPDDDTGDGEEWRPSHPDINDDVEEEIWRISKLPEEVRWSYIDQYRARLAREARDDQRGA